MICLKIAATSNVQLTIARKECGSRFTRSPNFSSESKNLHINPNIILCFFFLKILFTTLMESTSSQWEQKAE